MAVIALLTIVTTSWKTSILSTTTPAELDDCKLKLAHPALSSWRGSVLRPHVRVLASKAGIFCIS
jgi:hypothetical protein